MSPQKGNFFRVTSIVGSARASMHSLSSIIVEYSQETRISDVINQVIKTIAFEVKAQCGLFKPDNDIGFLDENLQIKDYGFSGEVNEFSWNFLVLFYIY